MRFPTALTTLAIVATVASIASAESWPPLDFYARECVLVVHVQQVGEHSVDRRAPIMLKVIETWVGEFDPDDFLHTRNGLIVAHYGEHGMTLEPGQEAIVFYTRSNQPPDKIRDHSTAFPIVDGTVIYAITGNGPEARKRFTLAEFRRRIEEARRSP
jgi:hypothetical protein